MGKRTITMNIGGKKRRRSIVFERGERFDM